MAKFSDLSQVAKEHGIGGGKGDWFKFEVGDNRVRIVSEYEVIAKHFTGRGQKPLVCVGEKNGCLGCSNMKEWDEQHKADEKKQINPHKPRVMFMLWVIDRKDNKVKILETGWSVIKPIADLEKDEEYAFNPETGLPDYDINIKKTVKDNTPSGTEYSVIPSRTNKPLTSEEQSVISELKPIKEVVDSVRNKVLKEYAGVGLGEEDVPPPADVDSPAGA